MDVRFDQTRRDKAATSIDEAGFGPTQRANLFIAAHGEDAPVLNGDGLGVW
jgi:hypothetical protein